MVISPPSGQSEKLTTQTIQKLIGPMPTLEASSNFLAQTLMNPNAAAHPSISYGFYRDKDLTIPFDEPPLFYQGVDEPTGEILSKVSDECMELKRVLLAKYPNRGLDLSAMIHIKDTLLLYYYDKLGDKTNISTMLQTSSAHRGLVHPMIEVDTPNGKKFMPNFNNRYFTEGKHWLVIVCFLVASTDYPKSHQFSLTHGISCTLLCRPPLWPDCHSRYR